MNKNEKLLKEFTAYCEEHPEQRFFQCLRNWTGAQYLLAADKLPDDMEGLQDTFYWNNINS